MRNKPNLLNLSYVNSGNQEDFLVKCKYPVFTIYQIFSKSISIKTNSYRIKSYRCTGH